jgi:hypothetical protein
VALLHHRGQCVRFEARLRLVRGAVLS